MEKMKHGAVYTIPDVRNPLLNVWRFRNDAELEQLIDNYFAEIKANNQ